MKTLNLIVACLFSFTCFGQTKLISFKSHSGSMVNFRSAVEQNLFDIGDSNFGLSTRHIEKVDSVVKKNNRKIIILIKSYNIILQHGTKQYNRSYYKDTLNRDQYPKLFSANSIDTLKFEIFKTYTNKSKLVTLDSALFIGFDKQTRQKGSR